MFEAACGCSADAYFFMRKRIAEMACTANEDQIFENLLLIYQFLCTFSLTAGQYFIFIIWPTACPAVPKLVKMTFFGVWGGGWWFGFRDQIKGRGRSQMSTRNASLFNVGGIFTGGV